MYYEELWDEAMDHVHDLVNHSPEAGDKTPAEKAGGHVLDIDNMVETFGSLVYYYESPERRAVKGHQTDPSARKGLYVGRSKNVSGGHRVIPITQAKGQWELDPTIERSYVVVKQNVYPLRLAPSQGKDPKQFDTYVDKCSAGAVAPEVYVVDKILDMRERAGEVEYKVRW